jgi:hypothetical protein
MWPLQNVLIEKYEMTNEDGRAFAQFLLPMYVRFPDCSCFCGHAPLSLVMSLYAPVHHDGTPLQTRPTHNKLTCRLRIVPRERATAAAMTQHEWLKLVEPVRNQRCAVVVVGLALAERVVLHRVSFLRDRVCF